MFISGSDQIAGQIVPVRGDGRGAVLCWVRDLQKLVQNFSASLGTACRHMYRTGGAYIFLAELYVDEGRRESRKRAGMQDAGSQVQIVCGSGRCVPASLFFFSRRRSTHLFLRSRPFSVHLILGATVGVTREQDRTATYVCTFAFFLRRNHAGHTQHCCFHVDFFEGAVHVVVLFLCWECGVWWSYREP